MSEFKVGDWVKRTDKITESIYQISSIDKDLIKCNFIKNGENWRLHTTKGEIEYATPEEIAAGHRIDKPSNSGELETLDKPENHISPNCKVGMFEMDKPMTFNEWMGKQGNLALVHANCCRIAYEAGQQSQQAKVEELKASHHGEVIGHEVHFKKIKQERDELQILYTKQSINMLKLQKRVDKAIRFLVEAELYQSEPNIDLAVKALKGE